MLPEPDLWLQRGVHWHGYVELSSSQSWETPSVRSERAQRKPDVVLANPDDVVDWISAMTLEHAAATPVRLIGAAGGTGTVGDRGHVDRDEEENIAVLCRGDSLYYDFPSSDDRMRLWVEAVTDSECREVHMP